VVKQDKTRITGASPGILRYGALLAALTLAGCASVPSFKGFMDGDAAANDPMTIGGLPRRDIVITPQTLSPASPDEVLATYRQALTLFSTAEQRSLAMRRMADLTMMASEESLDPGLSDEGAPGVSTGNRTDSSYSKAIALYLDQIQSAPPGTDLSETLYLLAKAYDLDAQPEKALEILDRLSNDYPGNDTRDEVEFRRGEQYFILGRYQEASQAYKAVIAFGDRSSFFENALYKNGWSLYKLADYEPALDQFITLLDRYLPPPKPVAAPAVNAAATERLAELKASIKQPRDRQAPDPKATETTATTTATDGTASMAKIPEDAAIAPKESPGLSPKEKARLQMQEDTLRASALAFSNMEGPTSVNQFLKARGNRHYSWRLYEALARLYIYQERYRDAADAYGAYVERHPFNPMSPSLSSKKIDVYAKGGFPTLVLEEKRNYVKQFGVYSAFWKRATPDIRNSYKEELRKHVLELAQHYHAQAQQGKDQKQYAEAARWYREYLAAFPKDENAPVLGSLLGESLFAAKDFRRAIDEFERAAYESPGFAGAQKAGYFSLLAYEEYLKELPRTDPTRKAWVTRSITATLRFTKTWPNDEHIAELYENVLDNQLALDDIKGAKASAAAIITRQPPAPRALVEKAWVVQANAQFDQRDYVGAEKSFRTILDFPSLTAKERSTFSERLATAIYKQAEVLQSEGMKEKAAEVFLRAAKSQPDADVGAKAEYDAATLLMETGQYRQAIGVLEKFRSRFPDHELAKTIPAKLSIAYEKIGDVEGSARELERVAAADPDNAELGQQAIAQAAALHEKKGNLGDAMRLYKQLQADRNTPFVQQVELRSKLAGLAEQSGDLRERDAWLKAIVDAWTEGGESNTPRTRFLAAEASFRTTEPLFDSYRAIRLSQPLGTSIKRKKQALSDLISAYKRTADIGVLQFTTAATFRMGDAYKEFAKAIMTSERPAGMADDALEEYELILEDQAAPLDDQAIALHEANIRRARDGAWDDWIKRSYEAMSKLQPGRYLKPELEEGYVDDIL
jgi:tetratricopeptide (TPR) repeat protein